MNSLPVQDITPRPARTNDANRWVTGRCWLYCRRQRVRVLWIGPVTSPSGHGAMYACQDCIAHLDALVRDESSRKDLAADAAPRRDDASDCDELPEHGTSLEPRGVVVPRGVRRQTYATGH